MPRPIWKRAVDAGLSRFGYSLRRGSVNRFDAMPEVLGSLAARGYRPRSVIDAGANVGQWYARARPVFAGARFHLIEPQPACLPSLEALRRRDSPLVELHPVALVEPGVESVTMHGAGPDGGGTGAFVVETGEPFAADPGGALSVPATTLDRLLGGAIGPGERTLLKLDLEGAELRALRGATQLLAACIEVVISEVQFYEIEHNRRPAFREVQDALAAQGFLLYDVIGLYSRPRDQRLRMGDVIFVKIGSDLLADDRWA